MVMIKRWIVLLLVLLMLPLSLAAEEKDCIYYFYANDCPECTKANQQVRYLETRYPELKIEKFEVYYERENSKELDKYFDAYNIPRGSRGIPVVFMHDTYYVGQKAIKDLLENRIIENDNNDCPSLEVINPIGLVGRHDPHDVLDTIKLNLTTKYAISDSLRPGMLAFLLVLLIFLAYCKEKEDVLRNGIIAVITLFIVTLLVGMGILFKGYIFFPKLVGILTIIGSIVRIKGFFGTWRIFSRSLSEELEQKIKDIVKYLISPVGSIMLSIVMAIFSFGTTSEIFNLLRTLAMEGADQLRIFTFIFYISLVSLIPAAILVGIVYKVVEKLEKHADKKGSTDQQKKERWRKHTQSVFNFVVSSLMLLVGFVLLFY